MALAVVTGSAGLVGSETTLALLADGWDVIGVDNDTRASLFGPGASTLPVRRQLEEHRGYRHIAGDVSDRDTVDTLFRRYGKQVRLLVHAAAQPSHDWSATDPRRDFEINALGTLNLLEAVRARACDAVFVLLSTNKVYGDWPNSLPLREQLTRWELPAGHRYHRGVDEDVSIDQCLHSPFGVSKASADLLTQEYARYFGLRAVVFRCGCISGTRHAGTALHGFLSHLLRCAVTGAAYTIHGHRGKQVRDNIDARDVAWAVRLVAADPRPGAVYNLGGGRESNCSLLEARTEAERICQRPMNIGMSQRARIGDHIWWISDTARFSTDYPQWRIRTDWRSIMYQMWQDNRAGWIADAGVGVGR